MLGVGYADLRKGFDLFLQAWRLTHLENSNVHFCWVGDIDPALMEWLAGEVSARGNRPLPPARFPQRYGGVLLGSRRSCADLTRRPVPDGGAGSPERWRAGGCLCTTPAESLGFWSRTGWARSSHYCDTAAMARAIGELTRRSDRWG